MTTTATAVFECGNCDWKGSEDKLGLIQHLHERVEAGEVMPGGECPKCGALCHKQAEWSTDFPGREGWYWVRYHDKHGKLVQRPSEVTKTTDTVWHCRTAGNVSFFSEPKRRKFEGMAKAEFGPRIEAP